MIKEMEDNENSFVALWSDKIKLDCATLYVNSVMSNDPFFNRVTDIDCEEFDYMLNQAENEFVKRNVKPLVYCLSNEKLKMKLKEYGFVLHDIMTTFLYEGRYKLQHSPDIAIDKVDKNKVQEWIDVYCSSFDCYSWKDEIERIISNSFDSFQLYIAYVKKTSAGCMILFEKNSLLGLYCLGTLARYRRAGVATALISIAAEMVKANGLKLFLQSLNADGLVGYYVKRGFTPIYTKEIYTKS
jgi:GNAT superfamily N-acetyltransferase